MKHFSTVCASASFVKQFIHLNVVIVLLVVSVWTGRYSGVNPLSLHLNCLYGHLSGIPFHIGHRND